MSLNKSEVSDSMHSTSAFVSLEEQEDDITNLKTFSFNSFKTSTSREKEQYDGDKELAVVQEPAQVSDTILRTISSPVSITPTLRTFMQQYLLPTMYKENGIGIAAVQVGIPIRAFILDVPHITHIDSVPVSPNDNDPRWVRKNVAMGKVVKVVESRPLFESGQDLPNVRRVVTTRILGTASDDDDSAKPDAVVDIERRPMFIINPIIQSVSEAMIVIDEGCLSVPFDYIQEFFGSNTSVQRPNGLHMTYHDEQGCRQSLTVDGSEGEHEKWVARCVLHEYDHLEGVLFTDKLYVGDN
jgi:peptide deformylase